MAVEFLIEHILGEERLMYQTAHNNNNNNNNNNTFELGYNVMKGAEYFVSL
jgi:hypothetical protein